MKYKRTLEAIGWSSLTVLFWLYVLYLAIVDNLIFEYGLVAFLGVLIFFYYGDWIYKEYCEEKI